MSQKWIILIAVVALIAVLLFTSDHKRTESPVHTTSVVEVQTTPKSSKTPQAHDWLIIPGQRVGLVTKNSTLADLQKALGKENVKVAPIPGPEGSQFDGVILYPNEPEKQLEVIWTAKKLPESVLIGNEKTKWHTENGVTVGTTLKELEKLNGEPFMLSGFYWDYGGSVLSWGDKGKLRKIFQESNGLSVQLSPPEDAPDNLANAVSGDGNFSSANPAMQALNPKVQSMTVLLR